MDILELAINPISDSSRAGEDCRYDPEFEKLNAEINRQNSISDQGVTNWSAVKSLATEILKSKSKNLNAAVYLFYANLRLGGLLSLSVNAPFFYQFLHNFWDDMYPPLKRMAGRKNILEWWIDKLSQFAQTSEDVVLESRDRDEILSHLNGIDEFLASKSDELPSLLPLIKLLEQKLVAKEERVEEPEAIKEPQAKQPNAAKIVDEQKAQEGGIFIDKKKAPDVAIAQVINELDSSLSEFLKEGVLNPIIFKISRIRAWSDIVSLPQVEGVNSLIPPPESSIKGVIDSALVLKNYKDALWEAESRICANPFWLDLQKYSFDALKALGSLECAEAVAGECALFITRFQGVEGFKFNDGTPFAGAATREWLDSLGKKRGGGNGEASFKEIDGIKTLVINKRGSEAIEKLSSLIKEKSDMRVVIRAYPMLLNLLLEMNSLGVFEIYANEAMGDIERFFAENWDSKTVCEIYEIMVDSPLLEREAPFAKKALYGLGRLNPIKAGTKYKK